MLRCPEGAGSSCLKKHGGGKLKKFLKICAFGIFTFVAMNVWSTSSAFASAAVVDPSIYQTESFSTNMSEAQKVLSEYENFASIQLVNQSRVHLHWKGDVPSDAMTSVHDIFGQIPVDVDNVDFSRSELSTAKRTVSSVLEVYISLVRLSSATVSTLQDDSGLEVSLNPVDSTSLLDIENSIRADVMVPLQIIVTDSPAAATSGSRTISASPFAGGSLFTYHSTNHGDLVCSTGFGVQSNSLSQDYLLTADHCFQDQVSTVLIYNYGAPSGKQIASRSSSAALQNVTLDAALMTPTSGQVSSSIFKLGLTSTSADSITGIAMPFVGQSICTDGANSGEHCGLTVTDISVNVSIGSTNQNGVTVLPNMVLAVAPFGPGLTGIADVGGDSGGPIVHRFTTNGYTTTLAVGIISGYLNKASCPTSLNNPTTKCGSDVFFAPIIPVLNALNVHLK